MSAYIWILAGLAYFKAGLAFLKPSCSPLKLPKAPNDSWPLVDHHWSGFSLLFNGILKSAIWDWGWCLYSFHIVSVLMYCSCILSEQEQGQVQGDVPTFYTYEEGLSSPDVWGSGHTGPAGGDAGPVRHTAVPHGWSQNRRAVGRIWRSVCDNSLLIVYFNSGGSICPWEGSFVYYPTILYHSNCSFQYYYSIKIYKDY